MDAQTQVGEFGHLLARLRAGDLGASAFAHQARNLKGLLSALPPRYEEVLQGLLDRLEAGALFSEESCSFSVNDLHDALGLWLAKTREQIAKG